MKAVNPTDKWKLLRLHNVQPYFIQETHETRKVNKLYKMVCSDKTNHNHKMRCLDFKKLENVLQKKQPKKQHGESKGQ